MAGSARRTQGEKRANLTNSSYPAFNQTSEKPVLARRLALHVLHVCTLQDVRDASSRVASDRHSSFEPPIFASLGGVPGQKLFVTLRPMHLDALRRSVQTADRPRIAWLQTNRTRFVIRRA